MSDLCQKRTRDAGADGSPTSDLSQKRTRDAGAAADAENCAVCRDAYGDKSLLKCGHSYCSGCIDDQLRVQQGDHRYE